jgi:Trypsin/PEP-CTERM motif
MLGMKKTALNLFAAIGITAFASLPAQAIVNSTPTNQFAAVGELGALSGVLIANNWVLTAAHVVAGITSPSGLNFVTSAGASFADAIYLHPSSLGFPDNDLALVHLSAPISASMPWLSDTLLSNNLITGKLKSSFGINTVTLVSPQNQVPSGKATATADRVMSTYTDSGNTYTTNWLVTTGSAYVQSGDSGSALFKGNVSDTAGATLLGIASAEFTEPNGSKSSAYVQVANYKSWINSTMAASGQQAIWASSVPEPSTFWLFAAALLGMTAFLRYRLAFGLSSQHTDGDSMVPRSHERDQKSHHRAPQAH